MSQYDIYQCSGADTLSVVEYLRNLGVRAWVPMLILRKRLPRSKKKVQVNRAAMPGYVFIPQYDAHLYDRSVERPQWAMLRPLWTGAGAQAVCGVEELTAMQELINERLPSGGRPPPPAVGRLVRITAGPFKGFGGVVGAIDEDGVATIELKNTLGSLKIPSCVLQGL